jgi:putative intracellular protease/amidase
MAKKILIPLPDLDFDVTEVATPWTLFKETGFEVVFATEKGNLGQADPLLIRGVLFGKLGASPEALAQYRQMERDGSFQKPISFENIRVSEFDALHLPGGHASGMRPYLENILLRQKVLEFWQKKKVMGSICHGILVLSRTQDPESGQSILYGKKVTGLTKFLERLAYILTFWKLGKYYRTYPQYVQDEVCRSLKDKSDFLCGASPWRPFIALDGLLLTARWPKDAKLYAQKFIELVNTAH